MTGTPCYYETRIVCKCGSKMKREYWGVNEQDRIIWRIICCECGSQPYDLTEGELRSKNLW